MHAVQPIGEQARELGLPGAHLAEQRIAARLAASFRSAHRVRRDPPRQRSIRADPFEHRVERRHFQRVEPLAQHRLERVFPAALDVELLPQAPRVFETARAKSTRPHPCRCRSSPAARTVPAPAPRARPAHCSPAARRRWWRDVAPAASARLRSVRRAPCRGPARSAVSCSQLLGHGIDLRGRRAARARCASAIRGARAAARARRAPWRHSRAAYRRRATPARSRRCAAATAAMARAASATAASSWGSAAAAACSSATALSRCVTARSTSCSPVRASPTIVPSCAVNARDLLGDLRDLLRQPAFVFARERELLLEPGDFGIGGVERALPLVQFVARLVVIGAQGLPGDSRRRANPPAGPRSATARLALSAACRSRARTASCCLANQSRCCACFSRASNSRYSVATLACASSRASCAPSSMRMSSTRARFSRVSAIRLSVSRRRSRYLETPAASSRNTRKFLGSRLDHAGDHALLDDGVGARPQARAQEQVVDVAAAHRNIVDVVGRVAIARENALDRQLGVAAPLPADPALAIVEVELDRGAADRRAIAGAVEDDVLHRLAAQCGRLRFAEHPAHGVDHVGFAAAVGADDADELSGSGDAGRVDERLEAGQFDLSQAQFEFFCTGTAASGGRRMRGCHARPPAGRRPREAAIIADWTAVRPPRRRPAPAGPPRRRGRPPKCRRQRWPPAAPAPRAGSVRWHAGSADETRIPSAGRADSAPRRQRPSAAWPRATDRAPPPSSMRV